MKTSWGKTDTSASNSFDDRIELIDDTAEARAQFGENYGAFELKLTRNQVEGLLGGKVVAFDINEREYTGFLSLKKSKLTPEFNEQTADTISHATAQRRNENPKY